MENGGGGEHRPWMYDDQTVHLYRLFATEHHRLAPYLMTATVNAINSGTSTITPLAERPDIPLYKVKQPSTYNYLLGPHVLVHPAMADLPVNSTDHTIVDAQFPAEADWLDWWAPHDATKLRKGATEEKIKVPLTSYSVFVRKGAMLPLERSSVDHSVLFTWFGPADGSQVSSDSLEAIELGTGLQGTGSFSSGTLSGTISAHSGSAGLVFVGITEPATVDVNAGGNTCTQKYDNKVSTLTVFCMNVEAGVKVTASGVSSIY
jgi:alpha-glucosidase (family GH31 glycosyl hydrolase)